MIVTADDLVPVVLAPDREAGVRARARTSVRLEIVGRACAVHFEDLAAGRSFARRYADLTIEASRPAQHEAFVVRDPELGPLFWSHGGLAYRWPHGDLPPHAIAFLADAVAITAFFVHRDDALVSLHAAVAGVPGGVAAIVGDSNVGKTTTSLACARAGMQLYSDERCVIDARSIVHPFPRAINVRAPGLRLLVQDAVAGDDPIGARLRARPDGEWNDARFSDIFGDAQPAPPQRLRAVFLLAGVGPHAALERTTASRAAKASARWAHGAGGGLAKIARLIDLFAGVACYALTLGTPDASARLIRARLEAECRACEVPA